MSAAPPPDGFYWLHQVGEPPEVVQVNDGSIFQCGSDVLVRLESWPDRHEFYVIEGSCTLTPIEPPGEAFGANRFDMFVAELKDLCRKHRLQISTSGYDGLEIWPLKDEEEPIHANGIEDMTSPGATLA